MVPLRLSVVLGARNRAPLDSQHTPLPGATVTAGRGRGKRAWRSPPSCRLPSPIALMAENDIITESHAQAGIDKVGGTGGGHHRIIGAAGGRALDVVALSPKQRRSKSVSRCHCRRLRSIRWGRGQTQAALRTLRCRERSPPLGRCADLIEIGGPVGHAYPRSWRGEVPAWA